MRRGFILAVMLLWASAMGAVDVSGTKFPDSVRVTPDSPELVLNGAGERRILLFSIYAIGLYLPARGKTMNEVLVLKGPKRMHMVMLRNEITARQVHEHVTNRIADGSQPAEMAVMKTRMADLDKIIDAEGTIQRGGTISLDYIPGKGTVIRVNDVAKGNPIPGEDFYNALLKIWLGERAKSKTLRDALLGRAAG
jgi:Chalcone isomerase-like